MATTQGISLNQLISSLSGLGAASGDLANISITGYRYNALPLTDYDNFANHVFFGSAIKRFENALTYVTDTYPIGLSAGDVASLCASNIFAVDKWKKQAKGFDLWLLDQLTLTGSLTASSTNDAGELVPLPWLQRSAANGVTGTATATLNSISAEAYLFEEQALAVVNLTPGTGSDHIVYGSTGEVAVHRGPNLFSLLPAVLSSGDTGQILERIMSAFADMLDELKEYTDQISNLQRISYDDVNRVPNKFLPQLASQYGVELFQSAVNNAVDSFIVKSSSGATTQEINYKVWQRITNNLMYLLKTKGTRETFEAITRIYGLSNKVLKFNEYSIFNKPVNIKETKYVDVPVLFSTGDVYAQVPTGSNSAFDFAASANFTIEARISATAALNHRILVHPLYSLQLDASGRVGFVATAGTTAYTTQSSLSSFMQTAGNFINIIASRTGDNLKVWAMCLSGSGSGNDDIVILSSGVTTGVQTLNYDSSAGAGSFGAYFPGSGSFSGYIHEVRAWNVALEEEDLKEHTKNFDSVSFNNSTATNSATWASLQTHYKLKENVILTGGYNFIVDSTTSNLSATPINFQNTNRYIRNIDMEKIISWYPVGLSVDNDKIRMATDEGYQDEPIVAYSINPIEVVNNDILATQQNLNISNLLGDPEDLYRPSYTGPFVSLRQDYFTRYGSTASPKYIIDVNNLIKSFENFNDVIGSIFPFAQQFLPARLTMISEGVMLENHFLERPKIQREYYSLTAQTPTALAISTKTQYSDTALTAATTATFQGFKYLGGLQQVITNALSAESVMYNLVNKKSSISLTRFYQSRAERTYPVRVIPSSTADVDLNITLSRIIISPTANISGFGGYIDGKIQVLRKGRVFKSDVPSLRFDFPSSADGNNYFVAQIGDIVNGRGRTVANKDNVLITKIGPKDPDSLQIKLQLSQNIIGLSADSLSLSGSIGVVPIRITNLFNNVTKIIRIGISNDHNIIDELINQEGISIQS